MDELLVTSATAFGQDSTAWPARAEDRAGATCAEGVRVVTVRHAAASHAARDAMHALGLAWPQDTGDLTGCAGDGPLVMRCQPEECLMMSTDSAPSDALLAALAPGRADDAYAVDLTHGLIVVALEGPGLDDWMARLFDAEALPRTRGSAARARMIDIAALLLRLADDRMWLVVDRALAPYAANWLAFTHAATFASTR